jgi:hypothetical protein
MTAATSMILHFTGNPWNCSCDALYRAYKVLRVETRKNITLLCESPEEVRGESWDILEERCELTTAKSTVTAARTADVTATYEVTEAELVRLVTKERSDQIPSPNVSSITPTVIFIICFAVAVCVVIALVVIIIRKIRKPNLNHLWWEDQVARKDILSE